MCGRPRAARGSPPPSRPGPSASRRGRGARARRPRRGRPPGRRRRPGRAGRASSTAASPGSRRGASGSPDCVVEVLGEQLEPVADAPQQLDVLGARAAAAARRPASRRPVLSLSLARKPASSARSRAQVPVPEVASAATRTPWRTGALVAAAAPGSSSGHGRRRGARARSPGRRWRRARRARAGRRGPRSPSPQTAAPVSAANEASASSSASRDGVGVGAVDERAVELEDVGRDADQLLQAGVAGARVVERDARAAGAQRGQPSSSALLGAEQLVLGQLDHDTRERSSGSAACTTAGEQRARADVEREEGAGGAARDGERGAQGEPPRARRRGRRGAPGRTTRRGRAAARRRSARAPRSRRRGRWRARARGWKTGWIASGRAQQRLDLARARSAATGAAASPAA